MTKGPTTGMALLSPDARKRVQALLRRMKRALTLETETTRQRREIDARRKEIRDDFERRVRDQGANEL